MAVNDNEQQYLDLARYVLEHGHEKSDRTVTDLKSTRMNYSHVRTSRMTSSA